MLEDELNQSKSVMQDIASTKGIKSKCNVILCISYAGTMSALYNRGFVQRLIERVLPIGMALSPKECVDVYVFSDSAHRVLPCVTIDNIEDYVKMHIVNKYSYGGTNFAPVMQMVLNRVIKENEGGTLASSVKSFFGLSKKNEIAQKTAEIPTYVLFITDNECGDKPETQKVLVEASKHSLYFQCIGMQTSYSTESTFLTKLNMIPGRFIQNTHYAKTQWIDWSRSLAEVTDQDLYNKLFSDFPGWLKEAISKQIVADTIIEQKEQQTTIGGEA